MISWKLSVYSQNKRMSHEWLKSFPVIGYRGEVYGSVLRDFRENLLKSLIKDFFLGWKDRTGG